jgi:hypothetical protein
MNKDKRKALITDLTDRTYLTPDDYVRAATEMADLASQGRTERWKHACTVAGEGILTLAKVKPNGLDLTDTRVHVARGIEAMEAANK